MQRNRMIGTLNVVGLWLMVLWLALGAAGCAPTAEETSSSQQKEPVTTFDGNYKLNLETNTNAQKIGTANLTVSQGKISGTVYNLAKKGWKVQGEVNEDGEWAVQALPNPQNLTIELSGQFNASRQIQGSYRILSEGGEENGSCTPEPTPTPAPGPTPDPTPTPTPIPTPIPEPTPDPDPTPEPDPIFECKKSCFL